MAEVLAPAIAAAREGAPVPAVIAGGWQRSADWLADTPGFAEVFMPGGRAPRAGEVFANPALARTLGLLASGGRDAFYRGPIAEQLLAYSAQHGGFFAAGDLAGHHSEWVTPVSTSYRGVTLWELPPNGQGIAALQMLNMLEGFDLAAMGRDSPELWHLLIEVTKLAYADRARGVSPEVDAAVEEALCFGWIDSLVKRLDEDRYARKFTPRTGTGKWSAANLRRIEKLKAAGLMTEIGLAKVPDGVTPLPPVSSRSLAVPEFFAAALEQHPTAREFFARLPPSQRRNHIHWVSSAKREATRQRRLAEAIERLSQQSTLEMK